MYVDFISYLWNQDLVAGVHTHWYPLPILVQCSWANSKHLCLVELLHGGLGEEDATSSLRFGLYALDEDTVEERGESLDGFKSSRLYRVALALRRCTSINSSHHFDEVSEVDSLRSMEMVSGVLELR